MYIYICFYLSIYTCTNMYICIYVYMHIWNPNTLGQARSRCPCRTAHGAPHNIKTLVFEVTNQFHHQNKRFDDHQNACVGGYESVSGTHEPWARWNPGVPATQPQVQLACDRHPRGDTGCRRWPGLHLTPHTLHPTLCTPHPTLCTPHPTPHTLHPTPHALHPTPYTGFTIPSLNQLCGIFVASSSGSYSN